MVEPNRKDDQWRLLEHDRTGGQLNYLNLDQVVMAEYLP